MTASELIGKVKNLAPVSHSALKLVALLDQPAISNEDIVQVLKYDNVLTAKLLRACNSPYFGLEEPVASVEQAVLMLGHQQILHIALSIAFSSNMAPLAGHAADANDLWQHSLLAALAAENMARSGNAVSFDPPIAFTAGLLHDIGKVVMNHVLTEDEETRIRTQTTQQQRTRSEAERAVVGVDHAEVGRCLLITWHLPEDIIEAVANHHRPACRPEPKLSAVVHAADALAHLVGANPGWDDFTARVDPQAVSALGRSSCGGCSGSPRGREFRLGRLCRAG